MNDQPDHEANCRECEAEWSGWAAVSNADRHHVNTGHTVEIRIRDIETVLGGDGE